MPLSFWIFLVICIVSFIPVIRDHGEHWRAFKERDDKTKWSTGANLFALWFVAIATLIGTLVLGIESVYSEKQEHETDMAFGAISNDLQETKILLKSATNELAKIKQKPFKERLIDCLNSIDVRIVPGLRDHQVTYNGNIESFRYDELERLAQEPEGLKYISLHSEGGALMLNGSTARIASLVLNPALLK
jgi:hypothetical protein